LSGEQDIYFAQEVENVLSVGVVGMIGYPENSGNRENGS